jgi:hypothetical protein
MYICPVCGYEKLTEPPENFNICCSCGTEFGFDDFELSYAALRHRWIANGCQWFSTPEGPPAEWDPIKQIKNLFYLQPATARSQTIQTPIILRVEAA